MQCQLVFSRTLSRWIAQTYRQKLRNAQLLRLVRTTHIRHRSDAQRRRTHRHQHHRKPQNWLIVQPRSLGSKSVDQRDGDGRPQNEPHERDGRPWTPGHAAGGFALFPLEEGGGEFDPHDDDLQGREEVADVLEGCCEPGVEVAAVLLVGEEEGVQGWDEADQCTDASSDERWV